MESIKYTRLYAGPDGESHFEDREAPLEPYRDEPASITQIVGAEGFNFRRNGPAYDLDWHPAPRRQFIVNLSGSVRIEASDGEVRVFGPGSILLVEDTTGKGHRSKHVGDEPRVSAWVHLEDGAP